LLKLCKLCLSSRPLTPSPTPPAHPSHVAQTFFSQSLEGAFQESGPLWTESGGATLQKNEYSWNLFSTQIFIEAPAGVGFSYADTPAGTSHNDTSTAADNLAALEVFFAAYPEYSTQPFWITGESYAGIYIPSLAYDIVTSGSKINLKGILVGNGCLGNAVGVCGSAAYGDYLSLAQYHGHGFISDKAMDAANAACGDWSTMTPACNTAARAASREVGAHDVYDLYAGMYGQCPYGARKGLKPVPRTRAPASRPIVKGSVIASMIESFGLGNTCTDDNDLTTYLGTPAVVAALHVGAKGSAWEECGGISYNSDIADERETIYPALMAAKLQIVIYNGEADACVPITDNQWWTDSLNLTTIAPWTAWAADDGTTGGYITTYQSPGSFSFVTIRGAGHMVPQVQPVYALQFAKAAITGTGFFAAAHGEL
jgi:carboxypeptidase C (cathepsin A)